MRRVLHFHIIVVAVAITGCDRAPNDELFPLEAGHRWTYRVTTQGSDGGSAEVESLTLRTMGQERLAALGDVSAWRRRSDSGVDYWLKSDATGIYRVASKSDLDAEPVSDKAPRYVLKSPYVVGTQWQASTAPYLLMRRNDFPREIRHSHPSVPMQYQIEATDDTVQTPAARHERCLRVRGIASVRLYADPNAGWRDLPLTTLEWYCPGVGLVKLERQEPARSAFLTGGTRTLELVAWQ